MSKVKKIIRSIAYTATWNAGVLTVVTATPHFAETGDLVTVFGGRGYVLANTAMTVSDANTFTVATDNEIMFQQGLVEFDFFRTGQTGRQVFTMPRSAGMSAVVQTVATGTGGVTAGLDASLDATNWVPLTSFTHTAGASSADFMSIDPAWVYLSVNITVIGAATKFEILYAG